MTGGATMADDVKAISRDRIVCVGTATKYVVRVSAERCRRRRNERGSEYKQCHQGNQQWRSRRVSFSHAPTRANVVPGPQLHKRAPIAASIARRSSRAAAVTSSAVQTAPMTATP